MIYFKMASQSSCLRSSVYVGEEEREGRCCSPGDAGL